MKTAFLFPGQGAQFVSMGKDIADTHFEAAAIFDQANDILGYDLKALCFEGPEEKLNTTTYSQPAIFTVSAAILTLIKDKLPVPCVTAGLSMGEYTALLAAGLVSFEDGLKLVSKRGQAMQAAAEQSDGSMLCLIGMEPEKVNELCAEAAEGDVLLGVNYNCPGQIVVSGSKAACGRAEGLAEKYGAMKAVPLAVSGAFHTSMMDPAATALSEALSATDIAEPSDIKVIANIDAEYYTSANAIRQGLCKQLTNPILWQRCMEKLLAEGIEEFYEIGPGKVLAGLMRRINRKQKVTNIGNIAAVDKILQS